MDSIDKYTRQCIRVSVAQICQIIGWTSIQSTPLEILTDLLQEYIMSLARMTNNYATHYGVNSPGVHHVGLSLKTIGVSFHELAEYVAAVEAAPALDVPRYPIRKESHLNLLKPGSREVVTRPVHIHEHLPPIHPQLQDEDAKEPMSTETASDLTSPVHSPKSIFKKPGDPDNLFRRHRVPVEEEVRALREITSVMMTTSGFLSPAREGKLPEARTPPSSQGSITNAPSNNEKIEVTPFVSTPKDRKRKKPKDIKNKEAVVEPEKSVKVCKEKSKLLKVSSKSLDRSPSPNPKSTSSTSTSGNQVSSKNAQRKQPSASPLQAQSSLLKAARSPMSEKSPKELHNDEIKLPSELDKQKLNIFKKISKVKDDLDVETSLKEVEGERWTGLDEIIDAVSRGNIEMKETVENIDKGHSSKEEVDVQVDVVSIPHNKENLEEKVLHSVEISRPIECKRKKKDKHKDKIEGRHGAHDSNIVTGSTNVDLDHRGVKPMLTAIEEHLVKSNLLSPSSDLSVHQVSNISTFPYYPFPTGVLSHPLIPQGPPVLGPYTPIPSVLQLEPVTAPVPVALPNSPPPIMGPPPSVQSTSSDLPTHKKKEHKKVKKLKDKLKKKKEKKDKERNKLKSEKKRMKLEKKEREKDRIKAKKEKKEKKKEKELHEDKVEIQNVPKITLKLSPVSSQDSPTDSCHRKIVIKPVVKKDDEKIEVLRPSAGNISSSISKPHKSQKSCRNDFLAGTSCVLDEEPKIVPPSVAHTMHHTVTNVIPSVARQQEAQSEYICPACNRPDDGSAMIACDSCDLWFHWICVGIQEPPESDWYCRKCTAKMDGISNEKRKKHRRKKIN